MAPVLNVVALSGSLRKAAYNNGLIRSAIELSKGAVEGIQIEHVDISSLPLLNNDLIRKGTYPPGVAAFRERIVGADSILFSLPENNNSSFIPAPLKNAIDWASMSPNLWADKPAAIVSTGGISQYHLRQIGVSLNLKFIKEAEFFLYALKNWAKFNSDGDLIDQDAKNELMRVLLSLKPKETPTS